MSTKKKIQILLFTSFFSLFFSCSNNSYRKIENEENVLFTIYLDNLLKNEDILFFSSLFNGIKTITLETNENCMIGRINKIRVFNKFIYILDSQVSKSLLVFNTEGHFIMKIGTIGIGPGEFVEPSDFTIDTEKNIIYILDGYAQQINKYKILTGDFINSIKLDRNIRSYHIEFAKGKLFADAYFSEHSDNHYLLRNILDTSGKEYCNYLNVIEYNKGLSNTTFIENDVFYIRENGNVLFVQQFMDRMIEINNDSIFSLLAIKSKDVFTPKDLKICKIKGIHKSFSEILELNKIYRIFNFIENKNWIIFTYMKGIKSYTVMINKITHKIELIHKSYNDLFFSGKIFDYPVPVPQVGCYTSEGVYYYFDSTSSQVVRSMAQEEILSSNLDSLDKLKSLDNNENPILFYYDFKD